MPEYHTEAKVFVPSEHIVNLVQKINDPFNISQNNIPFIQGITFITGINFIAY